MPALVSTVSMLSIAWSTCAPISPACRVAVRIDGGLAGDHRTRSCLVISTAWEAEVACHVQGFTGRCSIVGSFLGDGSWVMVRVMVRNEGLSCSRTSLV